MTYTTLNYDAPQIRQYQMACEGVLCSSPGGDNESYGGDPFAPDNDDNIIF